MKPGDMKIGTMKTLHFEILTMSNLKWAIPTHGSIDGAMAFYRHCQPSDDLPCRYSIPSPLPQMKIKLFMRSKGV